MKKDKVLQIALPILTVACIIAAWGISAVAVNKESLLPTLSATISAIISVFGYAEFYVALGGTLLRSLVAFCVSFAIAFVFAYFSYKNKNFKAAITPVIRILRALPTIAVVLLLLVWTNSQIAPVIVTMLVVLPTLYVNVFSALESIDKEALEACKIFCVDKKSVFLKVSFPQIVPSTLTAIGAGLSLNIKLMVAAEVLSFTADSIGYYLQMAKLYEQTAKMIALVVITVLICMVIEWLFSYLSKKAGKWQ